MRQRAAKKVYFNIALAIVLGFLIFFVFSKDYRAILDCLGNISAAGLLLLFAVETGYQLLESAVCLALVRRKIPVFPYRQAVELTFLGVFGNVSTSAAGTIPLQSYYLHSQGLKAGSGAGMMTLEYILHKTVVCLYGAVMMIVRKGWLKATIPGLMPYIYFGIGVCAAIILVLVTLCTWERMQAFLLWAVGKLPDKGKWRAWKPLWSENLQKLYAESREILKDRACRRKIAVLNLLKLSCLCALPFLCMEVLDISGLLVGEAQALSAVMLVISGALPNVAGVGSAEFAFLTIFTPYIGRVAASSALILYRIATYFFPFAVSILIFLRVKRKNLA